MNVHAKPILIRPDESMSTDRAAHYARRDPKTIRVWAARHGIGRQTCDGGPWEISRVGLDMVLHGDMEALERLRVGDRRHPDVARYFDFAGLPAL